MFEIGTLVFSIELDEHLQKGVDILTSYIDELRTFMIKFPWKLTDAIDEHDVDENVPKVKESSIWERLSVDFSSLSFTSARTFFRSDTCFHWARGKYRRQGKEMDLLTQIFSFRSAVPNLFSTRDQFHRRQFSHRLGETWWFPDDSLKEHAI